MDNDFRLKTTLKAVGSDGPMDFTYRPRDFSFDFRMGEAGEDELIAILRLTGRSFEVKKDFVYADTGNLFIEYRSRGVDSGLATTQAEVWAWVLPGFYLIIETPRLKLACRLIREQHPEWMKRGGDDKLSWGLVVPLHVLIGRL